MFDRLRAHFLRLLRVPHEPEPPAGAPGSVRVFRAGHRLYYLRILRWATGQLGALAGIGFSLWLFGQVEAGIDQTRREIQQGAAKQAASAAAEAAPASTPPAAAPAVAAGSPPTTGAAKPKSRHKAAERTSERITKLLRWSAGWPEWVLPMLKLLEWLGVAAYFLQIPFTFALVRLDYELRWYMVTDRSLRIRAGLTTVQESTMSFANIQQVVVSQNPVQRLLGLADVRVQSAGGGGDSEEAESGGGSLHTGVFHGVENAPQIRDLILERLRRFREAGLGDPEDIAAATAPPLLPAPGPGEALAAARELLEEARALRGSVL